MTSDHMMHTHHSRYMPKCVQIQYVKKQPAKKMVTLHKVLQITSTSTNELSTTAHLDPFVPRVQDFL